MKKALTPFVILMITFFSFQSNAQCPNCQIVSCSSTVPDGGLCDTAIPPGMANQPYDEDVSFYLPNSATISGTTVSLLRVKIIGIGGLPFGLDWESDKSPSNEYFPPNGENDGCVKICGTPIVPGNYTVTVFLEGDVNTPIGPLNNQPLNYSINVRVLPDTSSGGGAFTFNYSPTTGCGTTDVEFTTKFPSNGVSGYSYFWDFGNGNRSSSEIPGIQNYPPGTYTVISTVTIDTAGYRLSNISIDALSCNDCAPLIGCLGLPSESPDPYVYLHPNGNGTGPTLLNPTPNFTDVVVLPINIPINSSTFQVAQLSATPYSIKVIDDDSGNPLGGGNDACGVAAFFGHTAGSTTINGTNGLTVTVTIDHPIFVFTDTIQVTINPEPNFTVQLTADTLCGGDTAVLSVPAGAISYQWWEEGLLINGLTDSFVVVRNSKEYFVEVVDSNNCFGRSDTASVKYYGTPNTSVLVQGNTIFLNPPPSSSQFNVQYFLNNIPIPGANGPTYEMSTPGDYTVRAVNRAYPSCDWESGVISFTSIDDITANLLKDVKLYPNPNTGVFNLEVSSTQFEDAVVVVYDMLGKMVHSQDLELSEGTNNIQVITPDLPAGIYHLMLQTDAEQRVLRFTIN